MDPNEFYSTLGIEKDLVTGFSILFSRFEYCLKRTPGYASGNEDGVQAKWDKFASDHHRFFNPQKTKQLTEAVEFLVKQPPCKQIFNNGALDWKPVEYQKAPLLLQLVNSVKRVRNNLFHGGKFPIPTGSVEDVGRNVRLLQSSITILEECLLLNDRIREFFYEKG
jgi:hypothetical protein